MRQFWFFLLLATFRGLGGDMSWELPGVERIIAIGDLHGDLEQTRAALRLAGLIDVQEHWSGGRTVLVQTGDQLDRGDQERAIFDLLERLTEEAPKSGGAVYILNGNHELMNASLDFRYVTEAGFHDFQDQVVPAADPVLEALPSLQRGRAVAFRPGGPFALKLAKRLTVVKIGDTLFVHGGILPGPLAQDLGGFNRSIQEWLLGKAPRPETITGKTSPVWSRDFSDDSHPINCNLLAEGLKQVGAKRLVVGHTVQEKGINGTCEDQVWRIDVGLSKYYGGPVSVLEIKGDQVRALKAAP